MNERAILLTALEKNYPGERTAYLDAACAGDSGLRRRIEALLAAHGDAGNFPDEPAHEQVTAGAVRVPSDTEPAPLSSAAVAEKPAAADPGRDADLGFLEPPQRPDSLGRLAHYEVLEVLGKGGFGVVLKAFDDKLHRVVAIKVLGPQLAGSGTARQRFAREAHAAAAIRNEHVVDIHAVDDKPLPYLVMECVVGQTLQQKIDRAGPLELKEILRIGMQMAAGLAAAHAQGLIHRDIKPSNILLENGVERVKITDFGLARAVDDASLTQSGMVSGTPMYMAPEQAAGESLDHRADLFSLGSVLYAMCTGRPPFRASNSMAVLKRVIDETPRPIHEINSMVPAWLCDVIARLHAKSPQDRFGSAQEVADLLAKYLAELQVHGDVVPVARLAAGSIAPRAQLYPEPTTTDAVPSARSGGRRPPLALILVLALTPVVLVLLLLAALGIYWYGAAPALDPDTSGTVPPIVEPVAKQKAPPAEKKVPPRPMTWADKVATLPAQEQVKEVIAKMQVLNPGFDGAVTPTIENDVVVGLKFNTDHVIDILPLRALTELRSLECMGTFFGKGKLVDLSPLHGMKLTQLRCSDNLITDLSPLAGLPLTNLAMMRCRFLEDLEPLKDVPTLVQLGCAATRVHDLTPLRGLPLQDLNVGNTPITDLRPIKNCPLNALNVGGCAVRDFTPIRAIKTLKIINQKPADAFWKDLDAQDQGGALQSTRDRAVGKGRAVWTDSLWTAGERETQAGPCLRFTLVGPHPRWWMHF